MRDLPLGRLIAAMLALTVVIAVIMLIPDWNGDAASSAAGPIDTLLDVMIVLSSFVFSIVLVMLGYSIWRYRARPGDESDGEPIHGNTTLEIAWTLIPTIIVLIGAAYSWIVLSDIEEHDPDRMVVNVTAQQFAWKFQYPEAEVTTTELHVPVDRQVEFKLHAQDVLHSFWVPEWRIKKDAVPGITTRAFITPEEEGSYQLICTELCGLGHATMRAPVVAESEQEFEAWLADMKGGGAAGDGGAAEESAAQENTAGKDLFAEQGCSSCHTLEAAGSSAAVGPNLDEVLAGQDAEQIQESIVDPGAELSPGFSDGIMPTSFAQLSDSDLKDLIEFLVQSTQGK
jgi:cytochrome c oxidase subunit 2